MDFEDYFELGEEFHTNIETLVTNKAKEYIEDKIKELGSVKKNNHALRKTIDELENKIKSLETGRNLFEQALKEKYNKEYAEKEKHFLENYFNGYKIGDTVYLITESGKSRKCDKCSGTGELKAIISGKEEKINCPSCEGTGKTKRIKFNEVGKSKVLFFTSYENSKKMRLEYYGEYFVTTTDIFKTKEEAELKCAEYNKNLGWEEKDNG